MGLPLGIEDRSRLRTFDFQIAIQLQFFRTLVLFAQHVCRMKTLTKTLKVVTINLALLAVLVEATSIATYFFQTRSFFYGHSGDRKIVGLTLPAAATNEESKQATTIRQLHPYFGFIERVGMGHQLSFSKVIHISNNFGFASKYSYPFKRQNSNQFIVGIFGGSVAQNYSLFEMERNILAAELKKLPALADKEIIILSFAIAAYKQPQQLIVLNYFLSIGQDLDLVVNIDGFNEVTLSSLNERDGFDRSLPCSYVIVPLVRLADCNSSEEELKLTLDIIRNRRSLENSIKSIKASRFATGYLISWIRARLAQQRYRQELTDLDRLRTERMNSGQLSMQFPSRPHPYEDQVFREIVTSWSTSSLLMKQLLAQRNISYFEFIQPNQYEPTGRTFSKNERAIAIIESSNFRPGVVKGYPLLLAELAKLQQAGVNVQSAINAFDKVDGAVYEDDCCHYNERGIQIFGEFVAGGIVQALRKDGRYAVPVPSQK
jgi:hypothetical protein